MRPYSIILKQGFLCPPMNMFGRIVAMFSIAEDLMKKADEQINCLSCNSSKTRRALSRVFIHNEKGSIAKSRSNCSGAQMVPAALVTINIQ